MKDVSTCRLCSTLTVEVSRKFGDYSQQWYDIRHCPTCRFSFVVNPCTDYPAIYSAEYYAGRGAAPLVDDLFELERPRATIRQYEWAGIVQVMQFLTVLGPKTQWLDFGCGNGAWYGMYAPTARVPL